MLRGVNRAFLNDLEGAVKDFETFLKYVDEDPKYSYSRNLIEPWLDALKSGVNLFNQQNIRMMYPLPTN